MQKIENLLYNTRYNIIENAQVFTNAISHHHHYFYVASHSISTVVYLLEYSSELATTHICYLGGIRADLKRADYF